MHVGAALFGVSRYKAQALNDGLNRLQYAADDVRSFASYVRAVWSNADSLTLRLATDDDASSASWTEAIDTLHQAKLDLFIGYLAGHGIKRDGDRFHFCLHDADIENGIQKGIISGTEIDHAFARVGARTSILFLDCCHAEGIVAGTSYFRSLNGDRARLFLVSARSDQRAWEDDSIGHGLFSNAVMQGLADGSAVAAPDGFVDLESLFAQASENVAARAFSRKDGARQEPIRGGVAASPIRLPTASITVLNDQIPTHDALRLRMRRWLSRALLVSVVVFVVTDLSFQHFAIGANGNIVVRSGIWLFDPFRRIFPGGIIDTGFYRDHLKFRDPDNSSDYDALKHLHVNRLHGLRGWPKTLAPLLEAPRPQTSLSLLLSAELPASAESFDSSKGPPPLKELAALIGLRADRTIDAVARSFKYHVSEEDLDCSDDASQIFNFSHLNPKTTEFLREIDWRMVLTKNRLKALATVGRLVSYRLVHNGAMSGYDAKREFARFADWSAGSTVPNLNASGWCDPASLLVDALGDKSDLAAMAEQTLVETVRTFDLGTHGDMAPPEVEVSLFLLAIIARYRDLEDTTIDGVSWFLREDKRGLSGPSSLVQWLSAIAPLTSFPDTTRKFLIDALTRPETEFEFRQVKAFEILGRQSRFLKEIDRKLLLNWRRNNQDEWGTFDLFASGIAYLAPFMSKEEVPPLIEGMSARPSGLRDLIPAAVTWRGDTMVSPTGLSEWMAIARMAQTIDLSQAINRKLIAYAAVAPKGAPRTAALLAVAYQNRTIRSRNWRAFRRALGRFSAEAWRRNLLADAAATRLCADSLHKRRAAFKELRAMWEDEPVPIIRLSLGRTLQDATLCAFGSSASFRRLSR